MKKFFPQMSALLVMSFIIMLFITCDLANHDSKSRTNQFDSTTENLTVQRAKTPIVTLFAKAKYKGKKVKLKMGKYDLNALNKAGMKNNDVESIKVNKGLKAILYDGPEFDGVQVTVLKNTKKLTINQLNNKVSSVIVAKIDGDDDDDDDDDNDDDDVIRIGLGNDGNAHDKDDIGASAFAIAIIKASGNLYVHHDFCNHIGGHNRLSMQKSMEISVEGAAERFFGTTENTYNCQTNLQGAIDNITKQINISTPLDRFYYCVGGPEEVLWRGIHKSEPAKRKFCSVINHYSWSSKHTDTKEMTHFWADIKRTGVVAIQISNQNNNLNTKAGWDWVKNHPNPDVRWLYSRMLKFGDVSDCGVAYYVCTGKAKQADPKGDQKGNPAKLEQMFNNL